jgi:hypothetical protein
MHADHGGAVALITNEARDRACLEHAPCCPVRTVDAGFIHPRPVPMATELSEVRGVGRRTLAA